MIGASPLDLFAAAVAIVLPIAISPIVSSYTFTPKFAVLLIVIAVGAPAIVGLARERDRVALAGIGFLGVALISALISPSPLAGIFGLFSVGAGWLFWCAAVSAWAIGRSLTAKGRTFVLNGLLLAAVINGLVAIVQQLLQLSSPVLGLFEGDQADGLMGSPIFYESLLLGALAIALVRTCRDDGRWLLVVLLLSGALELSGERFALGLIAAIAAFGLAIYRNVRAVAFTAVAALSYGVAFASTHALQQKIARNVVSNPRLLLWRSLLRAIEHYPIFGFGPGQTGTASTAYGTLALARRLAPGTYFNDAHDILIEILVTTGFLGFIAFLAYAVPAFMSARGPLLGFALTALSVELIEPLNAAVTPLVFLAIGASSVAVRAEAVPTLAVAKQKRATAFLLAIACIAALDLLFGDYELNSGLLNYSYAAAQRGADALPVWSSPSLIPAQVAQYESDITNGGIEHAWLIDVKDWEQTAVDKQPTETAYVAGLAAAEQLLGQHREAAAAYQRAIDLDPYNVSALLNLAQIDLATGHRILAARLVHRADKVNHLAAISSVAGKTILLRH